RTLPGKFSTRLTCSDARGGPLSLGAGGVTAGHVRLAVTSGRLWAWLANSVTPGFRPRVGVMRGSVRGRVGSVRIVRGATWCLRGCVVGAGGCGLLASGRCSLGAPLRRLLARPRGQRSLMCSRVLVMVSA